MTRAEKEFAQKVFLVVYPEVIRASANKLRLVQVNGEAVDTTTFMNSVGAVKLAREYTDAAVIGMRDALNLTLGVAQAPIESFGTDDGLGCGK